MATSIARRSVTRSRTWNRSAPFAANLSGLGRVLDLVKCGSRIGNLLATKSPEVFFSSSIGSNPPLTSSASPLAHVRGTPSACSGRMWMYG